MITTVSSSALSRCLSSHRRFPITSNQIRWKLHSFTKQQNACRKSQRSFSNPRNDSSVPLLYLKSFGVGSLAGMCGSLAGMGGGFVMIPLMTSSLIRLSQHQAHGTSLFAVTTTGLAGALGYSGEVDFQAAALIACSGMVTARIGATVTAGLSETMLRKALGIFMICVAPIVPAKTYLATTSTSKKTTEKETNTAKSTNETFDAKLLAPAFIGLGSGFLAGLFGVGGGAVVVPALTVATDMTHYEALGTSLCAMSLPAIVGTGTHYMKGNVSMRVAPALAAGAFVGGFLGSKMGMKSNEDALRWGFSALMIVLGARTLMK